MGWVGSMLGGVLSGGGHLVGNLAGVILRALTSAITGGLRLIVSLPGRIIGGMVAAAQIGATTLSRLVSGTFGVIRAALSGAIGLLRTGVTALTGAATLLVSATSKAVQNTTAFARSISDIRAATGSGNAGFFGAFGMKGSDVAGLLENQNPGLFNMKAGIFGLPGYGNPNFLPALARQYQGLQGSGMIGQMMGRQRLQMFGMDTPEIRRILSQSIGDIIGQQNYQTGMRSSMGLNVGLLERATRQFDLLTQRLRIFVDTAAGRLTQELLPKINAVLTVATDYLARNSGQVAQTITDAVAGAWKAFLGLGRFLYADLPPMVLGIADSFLAGIEAVLNAIPGLWDSFLHGLDIVQQALGHLPDLVATAFGAIQQVFMAGFQTIGQMLGSVVSSIGSGIQQVGGYIQQTFNAIAQHPLVQSVIKAAPAVTGAVGGIGRVAGGFGAAAAATLGGSESEQEAARLGFGGMAVRFLLGGGALGLMPMIGRYGLQGAKWLGTGLKAAHALGAENTLLSYLFGLPQVTAGGMLAAAGSAPAWIGGGILGGIGYTALQRTGVLGQNAPGFWEALNNTRKRFTNIITGQDYNYDITQQNGYTAIDNARMAQAQAATEPLRNALSAVRNGFGGLPQFTMPQFGLPQLGTLNVSNASGLLGQLFQGGGIGGVLQASRGSWSQALDQRFGGGVRGLSQQGLSAVSAARAELDEYRRKYGNSDELNRKFDRMESLLGTIANNTGAMRKTAVEQLQEMGPFAERVIARAAAYNAQDAALTLLRVR